MITGAIILKIKDRKSFEDLVRSLRERYRVVYVCSQERGKLFVLRSRVEEGRRPPSHPELLEEAVDDG